MKQNFSTMKTFRVDVDGHTNPRIYVYAETAEQAKEYIKKRYNNNPYDIDGRAGDYSLCDIDSMEKEKEKCMNLRELVYYASAISALVLTEAEKIAKSENKEAREFVKRTRDIDRAFWSQTVQAAVCGTTLAQFADRFEKYYRDVEDIADDYNDSDDDEVQSCAGAMIHWVEHCGFEIADVRKSMEGSVV